MKLELGWVLLVVWGAEVSCSTSQAAEGVLNEILKDYNPSTLPRIDENETMSLEFGFNLVYLQLDRIKCITDAYGWEFYRWEDPRLKWDPAEHNGITTITVEAKKVWTPHPDFVLYSVREVKPEVTEWPNVILLSTGVATWIPIVNRKTLCKPKGKGVYAFEMKFGSWTMTSDVLMPEFANDKAEVSLGQYMERNEYRVTSNKAVRQMPEYECCPGIYPVLSFQFTVERKEELTNSGSRSYAPVILMFLSYWALCFSI